MYDVRMSVAKTIVLPAATPDPVVSTYHKAMARVIERPELDLPSARLVLGGYEQLIGEAAGRTHRAATTRKRGGEGTGGSVRVELGGRRRHKKKKKKKNYKA